MRGRHPQQREGGVVRGGCAQTPGQGPGRSRIGQTDKGIWDGGGSVEVGTRQVVLQVFMLVPSGASGHRGAASNQAGMTPFPVGGSQLLSFGHPVLGGGRREWRLHTARRPIS